MEQVWVTYWFARCRWCTWEFQGETLLQRNAAAVAHEKEAHPGTSREQAITIYWQERRSV